MPHPMIRSWQFAWNAQGRAPRTMKEMTRLLTRFEEMLAAAGNSDLTTATRAECENYLASIVSLSQRS